MKNSSHVSRSPERTQGAGRARDVCAHAGTAGGGQRIVPPFHRASVELPPVALVEELTHLFDLLSNETRLSIVLALRAAADAQMELCVCDLALMVGASPSMTSHQLRLLRDSDLVQQRREGKRSLYRLVDGPLQHLLGDGIDHATAHLALRPHRPLGHSRAV